MRSHSCVCLKRPLLEFGPLEYGGLVSSSLAALSGKDPSKCMHRYGRAAVKFNTPNSGVSRAVNRDVAEPVRWIFSAVTCHTLRLDVEES